MQEDFHYYVAYAIAKEAGFSKERSHIIAYASQYVDDNTDRKYELQHKGKYREWPFLISFPERLKVNSNLFYPIISQAVNIEAKEIETQRYVFAPFHFLPVGKEDNKYKIKGRGNSFCTIGGSDNAKSLLRTAVESDDPYRIGIAMHTYADTWSHERFTAFEEDWNKVKIKGLSIKRAIPPIGHAQILHEPDIISNTWKDNRFKKTDKEEVDNKKKAMEAIKEFFLILKPSGAWANISQKFKQIVDCKNSEERVKKIIEDYEVDIYEKDKWIQEALELEVDLGEVPVADDPLRPWIRKEPRFYELTINEGFSESHWYKFQNACKKQIAWVLSNISII